MRNCFALTCVLLSLAALVPLAGCGGSGSSSGITVPQTQAIVVADDSNTRSIRVTWPSQTLANPNVDVVEYEIFRRPADAPNQLILVGVTSAPATTFNDSTADRAVTYNSIVSSGSGQNDLLQQTTTTATGLTTGSYVYKIAVLYRNNASTGVLRDYTITTPLRESDPISF